jgi:hypothetical protein
MSEETLISVDQFIDGFIRNPQRLMAVLKPLAVAHDRGIGVPTLSDLPKSQIEVHATVIRMVLEGFLAFARTQVGEESDKEKFTHVLIGVSGATTLGAQECLLLLSSVSVFYESSKAIFYHHADAPLLAPFGDIHRKPGRLEIRWGWIRVVVQHFLKHEERALQQLQD